MAHEANADCALVQEEPRVVGHIYQDKWIVLTLMRMYEDIEGSQVLHGLQYPRTSWCTPPARR